jgi:predicted deacylase
LWTEIDLEQDGKQVGTLNLPNSVTRSAYGHLPIPLAVVRNGAGPTLFLMAGSHGDEWEGQIALARLIRDLRPESIRGRLIILPSANFPAARANMRVSPLDSINLNRAFPGDADGTPTQQIAHYIDTVLMSKADVCVDLHSGGASFDYLPCTWAHIIGDENYDARSLAALEAFGGDLGIIQAGSEMQGFAGTSSASAISRKVVILSGEYGGAAAVSPEGIRLISEGLEGLMAHLGMTEARTRPSKKPMRLVNLDDPALFLFGSSYGVFEPARALGEEVKKGERAGLIHSIEFPWQEPIELRFRTSGLLVAQRAIGQVEPGDCLLHLVAERRPA